MPVLFLFLSLLSPAVWANIQGFEDPAVLGKVMQGQIHVEDKISTKKELLTIFRAFFNKVSPDAYVNLATDHAKYPSMFSEVKDARTVKANADRTEFEYWMHVVYKFGIFSYDAYPEGKQVYQRAPDAISEAKLVHTLTNYKEYLQSATQETRLIPHQGGILIHDQLHIVLHQENAQANMVKSKLKEQFKKYLVKFREVLGGQI